MKPRLVIFCGKGGVGKTTLSLAFGLLRAGRGQKTVVVTSHPLSELAVTISLDGLEQMDARAAENLFVIHIDSRRVLAEMVRKQIPTKWLAQKVLSSKIYNSLVEIAPGLKEIAFLSRLRDLAEKRSESEQDVSFDCLIWDAPATGHFFETLRVSKNFEVYLTGPFASLGRELQSFFSERARMVLLPVTTLEEMAVTETLELCGKLAGELNMPPAGLICNLASPLVKAPKETLEEIASVEQGNATLQFIRKRHDSEREQFGRLCSSLRTTFYLVERARGWGSDLDLLSKVAAQLERIGVSYE